MSDERNVEAGRELDALIAEKVMGYVVRTIKPDWYPYEVTLFCDPASGLVVYSYDPNGCNAMMFRNGVDDRDGIAEPLPYHSDDMATAWPVAEKLGLWVFPWDGGWVACHPAHRDSTIDPGIYVDLEVGIIDGHVEHVAHAETPALAICRAALKAVGA